MAFFIINDGGLVLAIVGCAWCDRSLDAHAGLVSTKSTGLLMSVVHKSITMSLPRQLAVKLHGAETNLDGLIGRDSVERELDFLNSLLQLDMELSDVRFGSTFDINANFLNL